ncbi:MAG: hypothetical protein WD825_08010 [Gemmatimonadaceae bacterium]
MVSLSRAVRWMPTVLTWALLLAVVLVLGWSYLANPQPSPYGMCYAARGRPMPCELVKKP